MRLTSSVIVGATAAVGVATLAGYAAYQYCGPSVSGTSRSTDTKVEETCCDDDELSAILGGNEKLFDAKEKALLARLIAEGQGHLFAAWPAVGVADAEKQKMVAQLVALDNSYHGGLSAYTRNAKQLLKDSKEGVNPFEGFTPTVPTGEILDFATDEFMGLEQAGLKEAASSAFVLVAGGLGERLGYSGIKVALPCECASGTLFLEYYINFILALQKQSGARKPLPFAIMTSDDTHARTLALLEEHNYFGMGKDQLTLIKQEKVACLIDNDAHLALDAKDSYQIQTKPHGHGDVHALLHSTGLAQKWDKDGFKWVCFFQDTNALVFRALTAALGVSAKHNFDMNSLAVPRKAKEAIGAISQLKHKDGHSITINVEYNQLDPLLRETISPEGDVNDSTGFSPFPGNINQIVLKLHSYSQQLARTGGVISEFINPKYKDSTKTEFKSSTRLECMMQDYPKALPQGAKVGFTTVNQGWSSYSPVKNNPEDALVKAKEGNPTHSATTGELDIYKANALMLQMLAGAKLPPTENATFNGITTEFFPRVVLAPSFAPVLSCVKDKIKHGSVTLAPGSVLILDGPDISIEGPLSVDGALVVKAVPGAKVTVGELSIKNAGWTWKPIPEAEKAKALEEDRIRGFHVLKTETMEVIYDKEGAYTVATETAPPVAAETAPPVAPETTTPVAAETTPPVAVSRGVELPVAVEEAACVAMPAPAVAATAITGIKPGGGGGGGEGGGSGSASKKKNKKKAKK